MQARKPRKAKLAVPTERSEQRSFVKWFYMQYPNKRLAKFCNEGKRTELQTSLLIYEGMLVGAPDMVIFVARRPYHGLLIEMKRRKHGIVSKAQQEQIAYLNSEQYLAIICFGWDDAREATIKYMNGEKW